MCRTNISWRSVLCITHLSCTLHCTLSQFMFTCTSAVMSEVGIVLSGVSECLSVSVSLCLSAHVLKFIDQKLMWIGTNKWCGEPRSKFLFIWPFTWEMFLYFLIRKRVTWKLLLRFWWYFHGNVCAIDGSISQTEVLTFNLELWPQDTKLL